MTVCSICRICTHRLSSTSSDGVFGLLSARILLAVAAASLKGPSSSIILVLTIIRLLSPSSSPATNRFQASTGPISRRKATSVRWQTPSWSRRYLLHHLISLVATGRPRAVVRDCDTPEITSSTKLVSLQFRQLWENEVVQSYVVPLVLAQYESVWKVGELSRRSMQHEE